jgi:hypothetical protein
MCMGSSVVFHPWHAGMVNACFAAVCTRPMYAALSHLMGRLALTTDGGLALVLSFHSPPLPRPSRSLKDAEGLSRVGRSASGRGLWLLLCLSWQRRCMHD